MVKISTFVDESSVPQSKRGGPPNPEIAEIVQQLIDACDGGNTQFAFIPVEDKIERKRIGESIRQQARNRGYSTEKVAGTRNRKVKGQTVLTSGLFIRLNKPEEVVEAPKLRRRRNGAE